MKTGKMNVRVFVVGVSASIAAFIWAVVTHRTEVSKEVSPSGQHTAICSYRTYLSLLPMTPGSSSDKPCFVKIVDREGRNCGEMPVPMIQMAGVEWTDHGAEIKLIGEWDFNSGSCFYWSEDQNSKIFAKR